jgi:hypothetical protein
MTTDDDIAIVRDGKTEFPNRKHDEVSYLSKTSIKQKIALVTRIPSYID